MKILYLNPMILYPPFMGNQMTGLNRVKYLSRQHEITLVCFYSSKKEIDTQVSYLEQYCEKIIPVYLPKWKSFLDVLTGSMFSSKPLQLSYYASSKMKRIMSKIVAGHDVVHVNTIRMEQFVDSTKETAYLVDLHDSMILNIETRVQKEKGFKKIMYTRELKRITKYEKAVVKKYRHLAVLAEKDKEVHGNTEKIEVIHLGVDTSIFNQQSPLPENRTIIFSGNMSYTPNVDAVIWFLENCWQLILAKVPDALLKIVGVSPVKELDKYRSVKGVEITGRVESMSRVMGNAQLAIVPLWSGSGMQNKVLEAMACGLPVICTTVGLGSIRANHGENVLIADDSQLFAGYCIELLFDHKRCKEIGENALRLIKEQYSIEHHCDVLEALYKRIVYENKYPSKR